MVALGLESAGTTLTKTWDVVYIEAMINGLYSLMREQEFMLTLLISSISSSSSYSDSSSELLSCSDELVSVVVDGEPGEMPSSRSLITLSDRGREPWLVPLYLLTNNLDSLGGRPLFADGCVGVDDAPKLEKEINMQFKAEGTIPKEKI
jgi:hypothetical protein